MPKRIYYGDDARARLLAGVNALADAVAVTYGPLAGNVVIGHTYYEPTITHDGVTAANHIELEDGDDSQLGWKVGAELIKSAANNLNNLAGDGTTTVTVLTREILAEAIRLIAAGNNKQEVRKGIEQAGAEILKALEKLAEAIEPDSPRIEQIASISAGDKEIGKLLAEVIKVVGRDAVLTVETHEGINIDKDITEGFSFEYGMVTPAFITDAAKREAVFSQSAVIIYDGHINESEEIRPLMSKILQTGVKNIILFAGGLEKEVIRTFVDYKVNDIINPMIIKPPSTDDAKKAMFEDIAIFTGATVIKDALSGDTSDIFTLANAELAQVGRVDKAIIGQDKSTLIDGSGNKKAIETRIKELKEAHYDGEYQKEIGARRAAALSGKVVVIKVGGATELELEERKYRVDDAVAAVQAALADGIVAGGGVTLINLADNLVISGNDSRAAGMKAVKKALERPFLQIMENAGLVGDALLADVRRMQKVGYGVDITQRTPVIVDMKAVGVIDPILVTKEVIKNAISIAATAATMGALVVEIPVKSIANNA